MRLRPLGHPSGALEIHKQAQGFNSPVAGLARMADEGVMLSMPPDRSLDILAIGEPLYEFAQEADGRFRAGFGGDTSNVAIAAARLGAKAAYATLIGADMFGDQFIDLWRREGVDAAAVKRHATAPTGVYVVTQAAQGHVFSYLRQGSAASRMTAADVPREAIAAAKVLHVSGISLAISASAAEAVFTAVREARSVGTVVSFDTNLRLRLWPIETAGPKIHEIAALSDILKTSLEDGRALTGLDEPRAIAQFYRDLGGGIVVVTLGADGAIVMSGSGVVELAAHQITSVDATGAGDAFTGAFLAELCRGAETAEAAHFANAAAALSTLEFGAVAGLPQREDVMAFLAG